MKGRFHPHEVGGISAYPPPHGTELCFAVSLCRNWRGNARCLSSCLGCVRRFPARLNGPPSARTPVPPIRSVEVSPEVRPTTEAANSDPAAAVTSARMSLRNLDFGHPGATPACVNSEVRRARQCASSDCAARVGIQRHDEVTPELPRLPPLRKFAGVGRATAKSFVPPSCIATTRATLVAIQGQLH